MPLNGLRGLKINLGDMKNLEILDLSYNNLSALDLLTLGLLPSLRVLHLTGNSLKTLPAEMARPFVLDPSILGSAFVHYYIICPRHRFYLMHHTVTMMTRVTA